MTADTISIEELRKAHRTVAQLLLMDRVYLPIFARIEGEIEARLREDDLLARARMVANG
jgi:hypothetical protein